MLGVVGFDLVPEALTQQPGELFGVPLAMLAAVLGFLTLHIVERSAAIHRAHEGEYAGHLHAPGVGIFAASALVGHSLLDGVAIGAGFQAGSTVGAVVAIAVLSHDFADGFNTYTITSLYGNDRRRALTLLVADALAPVAGAAITLIFTIPPQILGLYLGFFAGVLLPGDLRHPSRSPRPPPNPPHLGLHGPRRRLYVAGHRPRRLSSAHHRARALVRVVAGCAGCCGPCSRPRRRRRTAPACSSPARSP
jgi:zinc and cadmium transporter